MKRRNKSVDRALAALRRGGRGPAELEVLARGAFAHSRFARPQADALFAELSRLAMARSEGEPIRRGALYGLRGFFDRRAARVMLSVLRNRAEVATLRAEAAEGLGAILEPPSRGSSAESDPWGAEVSHGLGEGLVDSSADIRFWATYAIGMLQLAEHRKTLESLTRDEAVAEGFWSVGLEATDVLAVLDGKDWPTRERPKR